MASTDIVDIDALVCQILEDPEIVNTLSDEQILAVQKKINPYCAIGGPPPKEGEKRSVACSYTNIRENYLKRFVVTSLSAFMYQMYYEWDVSAESRRWTPANDDINELLDVDTLADRLEKMAKLAAIAKEIKLDIGARKLKIVDNENILNLGEMTNAERKTLEESVAEDKKNSEIAEDRFAGIMYTLTTELHYTGVDAKRRFKFTDAFASTYPEGKEVKGKYNVTIPANEFEFPADKAKSFIGQFLDSYLSFDSSVHARSGHDDKAVIKRLKEMNIGGQTVTYDPEDPTHVNLEVLRGPRVEIPEEFKDNVAVLFDSRSHHNAAVACLNSHDLSAALADLDAHREEYKHFILPIPATDATRPAIDNIVPQDTHHRFNYYMEVNYDKLRAITNCLYPERTDLDLAIGLWEYFAGNPTEVDDKFKQHCRRYEEETPAGIKQVNFGGWTILTDCKKNRKNIDIYNKNTMILKGILDRFADDQKVGQDLMRNRVKQTKSQNIAKSGGDATGLRQYQQSLDSSKTPASLGAQKVLGTEEIKRLEMAKGNRKVAQEIEFIDGQDLIVKRLTETKELRKLAPNEEHELATATDQAKRAREALEIPEDAIQIDAFVNRGGKDFSKTTNYVKSSDAAN